MIPNSYGGSESSSDLSYDSTYYHHPGGQVVVEAELDNGLVASRLRREIADLYGHPATVRVLAAGRQAGRPAVSAAGR